MKITLKLFASLSIRLPAEARSSHCLQLDLDPGTTVLAVIQDMGLQSGECAIVLVDGVWVAQADLGTKVLEEGQALAIWPPVAGG